MYVHKCVLWVPRACVHSEESRCCLHDICVQEKHLSHDEFKEIRMAHDVKVDMIRRLHEGGTDRQGHMQG